MNDDFVKLSPNSWSNSTFLFPCISVGNIGQLAVDLLISTVPDIKKAGYLINHKLVQPIIGYDPYNKNSSELSLSVELYESAQLNLVIMQQRAPLFKGKRNDFVNLLIDFIKREKFRECICLTSSHAYERLDSQIYGDQCRFLSTGPHEIDQLVSQLKWFHLEKRNNNQNAQMETDVNDNNKLDAYIPGGGIAQKFYKFCDEQNLNSKVLIIFAHEGNNIPEAFSLVNYLNQWKNYLSQMNKTTWQIPISWNYLFGQNIDRNTEAEMF